MQIALGALSSQDTGQLIQLLSGETTLAARVQQHIVAKTDGVPLFVEELTRSMLEGGESSDWRELPTTLRDSLTARLSRLGTAKEVAQLASVIGRAFSLKLLAAVAAHPVDTLERELRKLVQSGLVHRRGFGADPLLVQARAGPRRGLRLAAPARAPADPPADRRRDGGRTPCRRRRAERGSRPSLLRRRAARAGVRALARGGQPWRWAARPTPKPSPTCSTASKP